jgi:hypothetical protein
MQKRGTDKSKQKIVRKIKIGKMLFLPENCRGGPDST